MAAMEAEEEGGDEEAAFTEGPNDERSDDVGVITMLY